MHDNRATTEIEEVERIVAHARRVHALLDAAVDEVRTRLRVMNDECGLIHPSKRSSTSLSVYCVEQAERT